MAWMEKRAVANNEISFNLLKAGMKALGQLSSKWRLVTARLSVTQSQTMK